MPGRPPRVTKTEAIVLRYRRLGDADRIVSLLTPHRGKIDVVARGVLRARSKLAGHLEPGTRLEVALAAGRSMDIVTQAQGLDSFGALRDDLDRLSAAMYVLELADRLTVEHADAHGLYGHLHNALIRLARGDGHHLVVRTYELAILDATGFRPEFTVCLGCGEPVEASRAWWSAIEGGVYCSDCAGRRPGISPIDGTVLKVLRAYQSQPYEEAGRIRLSDDLAARLEATMHALMHAVVEREIGSARFISATRRARVNAEAVLELAEADPGGGDQ
ncbi:MAG: DNA repair protein RecO [Dehalococcoidia bacterium]|nr:DNA repair protein RecO [Dehalococcoidia bacterium]